ncbi:MAG: ATP-binding protein, partial [Lachnospiraceae bacterium]|nr:ATP-binding protein [Lachnospiraceae bacterium]
DDGFPLAINEKGETINFTQRDVREIQLAKSAVRAGFETLLKRYGAGFADIDKLYIAGGFGFFLDPAKAAAIGMIPEELLDRCVAAGNTSLAGAVKYLSSPDEAGAHLSALAETGEEIVLSSDKDFNKLFMEYMMF